MNSDSHSPKFRESSTFKFEGQGFLLIAVLAISGFFLFLGVAVETGPHKKVTFGEVIIWGGCFFFCLMGMLVLRRQSAIVVDGTGISRSLFGWEWQKICWNNIRIIKTFPYFHPAAKKMVRIINIYPLIPSRFRATRTGGVGFIALVENVNELTEIINHYVNFYEIRIEFVENGKATSISHL